VLDKLELEQLLWNDEQWLEVLDDEHEVDEEEHEEDEHDDCILDE